MYPHGPTNFLTVLLAQNLTIKLAGLLGGKLGTTATPI